MIISFAASICPNSHSSKSEIHEFFRIAKTYQPYPEVEYVQEKGCLSNEGTAFATGAVMLSIGYGYLGGVVKIR